MSSHLAVQSAADLINTLVANDEAIEGNVHDVATTYAEAVRLKAAAQSLIDACTESLIDRMEDDTTDVPGVGLFARTTTSRKRNRYDDSAEQMRSALAEAVARSISFDVATGELDPMKRNIARAAVNLATQHASVSGLKQTARTALDIAPDDFYEFHRTTTIKFTPGMEVANV